MNQTIKVRRTFTPNAEPAPGSLEDGELALNLAAIPARMWAGVPATIAPSRILELFAGTAIEDAPDTGVFGRSDGEWVQVPIVLAVSPTDPAPNSLWWDSSRGRLFLYFDDAWVEIPGGGAGPQGPAGPSGADGLDGATGPTGATGERGETGAIDAPGVTAPIMLRSYNGAPLLSARASLVRINDVVFLAYQGTESAVSNTYSLIDIPYGFGPTANVSQAITTPAVTMNVQRYTTGLAIFPDDPGVNNVTGFRWSVRASLALVANAALSISMFWRTNDLLVEPEPVIGAAPIMLSAANGVPNLTGADPVLSRTGDVVTLAYTGANKNNTTAATVSLFWIPEGFRPTASVTNALTTPAGFSITLNPATTGTSVFADAPATNNLMSGRYVARGSALIAANAAVNMIMQWLTNDPMP